MPNSDIITPEEAATLDGLFAERTRRAPDDVAYLRHDADTGGWQPLTWAESTAAIARWRTALAGEGLTAGDRVAIQAKNSCEWVFFDQAALSLGLVVVPLYLEDRADSVAYVLADSGARLVVLQSARHWRQLAETGHDLKAVQSVVLLDSDPPADNGTVKAVKQWLPDEGESFEPSGADPNSLATIVYTSGTTGRPKGVMLSHRNILWNAWASLQMLDAGPEDRLLSFLPLSHTLERTGGYYLPIMIGASVAHARSINQLPDDLQAVQPTVLIGVPRIFERVHRRLEDQLAKQAAPARWLFHLATWVGWRRFEIGQGRARWTPEQLLWPLCYKAVAGKIHERFGGALRLAVAGGAPLQLEVARTFLGLGLPVLQGYGLTETAPVVSVNRLEDNDPASVGRALPDVEVKTSEDGELLIRSPGVMLGYWNLPDATAEKVDSEGWFHSEDQARIHDGRIYITGRTKDIIVLSNGEKVPPSDMELAIAMDPWIDQVMVVGEGQAYLGALVVISQDHWREIAGEFNLNPDDDRSLRDKALHRAFLQRIRKQLADFPGYAKIRRIALFREPWTVEEGLQTPTMKLKRAVVAQRHHADIENLFRGAA